MKKWEIVVIFSLSSQGSSLRLLTDFVKDVFTSEVEIQHSENSARDALLLEFPTYFPSFFSTYFQYSHFVTQNMGNNAHGH